MDSLDDDFTIGQLWVSETEPELGACEILDIDAKRVRVSFLEAREERVYSRKDSPLKRARLAIGDAVSTSDGESLTITSVRSRDGLIWYGDGSREYPENELSVASLDFSDALARFKNLDIDSLDRFHLRQETLRLRNKVRQSPERGLFGGRIELIPHQLYVAEGILSMANPRAMLADEVGLGKTIEACLIVHRLIVTGQISRVLVLLPDSLIHQWFVEFYRRFNLTFSIFDEERCRDFENDGGEENPFNASTQLICGIDFLVKSPKRAKQIMDVKWDLLIVDEAHHLEWDPETGPSPQYAMVMNLCGVIEKALLLSGTPEQLGLAGHFARLALLDPARYYDLDAFIEERGRYADIANLADKLVGGDKSFSEAEEALLNETAERFGINENELDKRRDDLLNALIDQHGTGRAVFRNTRHVVKGFPRRVASLCEIPRDDERFLNYLRHEFDVEKNHKTLDFSYDYSQDPRIPWLLELTRKLENAKILLICHTKEKAAAIKNALLERANFKLALFHEDMTIVQRDREAAWFSRKDGARVLICSEIGGEGRNFQFAHHLVMYDLPLNPALLEQRIGRLDRIGQQERITIHIPYLSNSPQEVMVRWYHEGLNALESHLPGGHEFLAPFTRDILNLAIHPHKSAEIDRLIGKTRAFRDQLVKTLEKGRDHLLEIHSFNPRKAREIVAAIKNFDHAHDLEEYMLDALDQLGVNVEAMSRRSFLISPTNCLRALPWLPREDVEVTCSRSKALEREEISFISWDHPLIVGIMDVIGGSEFGNNAFAIMTSGTNKIMLETVYVLECHGASELHADRFLAHVPIRVLIDHENNNLTEEYPEKDLRAKLRPGPKHLLAEHPELRSDSLKPMLEFCHRVAERQADDVIKDSKKRMENQIGTEVRRLVALKRHNPNIRQEEIDVRTNEMEKLDEVIARAKIRLDSLRLILCRSCFQ